MMNINSFEAIDTRVSRIQNKEIKSIAGKLNKALAKENGGILEACYQLARLQAVNADKWQETDYKGFGNFVGVCFGMSESTASRRALVGRLFCTIDDAGTASFGKYGKYSFTVLFRMAETFKIENSGILDVEETLKAIDNFTIENGITSKTASREVFSFLPTTGSKTGKDSKTSKDAKTGKSESANNSTKAGAVEVISENAIAAFGKNARALAKTATPEQLKILIKLVRSYERATGTTIDGCSTEKLEKLSLAGKPEKSEVKPDTKK